MSDRAVPKRRGRPKKKPDYCREKQIDELVNKAVSLMKIPFDDRDERPEDAPTIGSVAKAMDTTAVRVRKLLITADYYSTETSRKVQKLRKSGLEIEQIIEKTGLGRASVYSYIPYEKGAYLLPETSVIDASDAHVMDGAVSFMDLIRRADNYGDIPFDSLEQDKTYIFELVAPEQKIVIRYEYPYLYHIGTRDNITGQESQDDIGIRKPAEYPLHSLRECISAAKTLNQNGESIEHEGFVVVDANWHRIKVKSPEYVYAHRVRHVMCSQRRGSFQ